MTLCRRTRQFRARAPRMRYSAAMGLEVSSELITRPEPKSRQVKRARGNVRDFGSGRVMTKLETSRPIGYI